jgi:hypothetical protein
MNNSICKLACNSINQLKIEQMNNQKNVQTMNGQMNEFRKILLNLKVFTKVKVNQPAIMNMT